MNLQKQQAYEILKEWKGDDYVFGLGVMDQLGKLVQRFGRRALVVASGRHSGALIQIGLESMKEAGVEQVPAYCVPGARPNTPREDVYRLESYLLHYQPDCVVAIGGGSTIDACKAAIVLAAYGKEASPEIDAYFGTGLISQIETKTGCRRIPLIAVETAASSGAHLTKYSNITDPVAGQKKLIVDPAITPDGALFDYSITASVPMGTTLDGALDGIAHTFEAFCGAKPENYELLEKLAVTCLDLTLDNAIKLQKNPADPEAREGLGLATDLGGYAIMVGGTSGAHLTSFSLVDLTAHGAACGIMNPYYAVLYTPAIQPQLKSIGRVLAKHGYVSQEIENSSGRELSEAVAEGLIAFGKTIHAPTKLSDLKGFGEKHIQRILTAAKDPSLSMKLKNMPVPMTAEDVVPYMESVILAAAEGNLSKVLIKGEH